MKRKGRQILAVVLCISILFSGVVQRVQASSAPEAESIAAAESSSALEPTSESSPAAALTSTSTPGGKYISEVFIAYGKTEDEAKQWLKDNGWETLANDSNVGLGKASSLDNEIAAVIGIKRTNNAEVAITDMAVMNMNGDGYSFSDYESLVKKKNAEIDEYVRTFIPTIIEYRKNYNGEGSEFGKKRADMVYKVLNRFYDGEVGGEYAINDTGMHLGDMFLSPIKQEIGDEMYNALPEAEKRKHGDLRQIILEGTGSAEIIIEQLLAIAADASETTWIERLQEIDGDELSRNIAKYVPSIQGQDLADSAILQLLFQEFGDTAAVLASQWQDIRSDILWYENYNLTNDLWEYDDESDEDYSKRVEAYFTDMEKNDKTRWDDEYDRYMANMTFYETLHEITYEGEWGETLGDFFSPYGGKNFGADEKYFLPFAAALSEGQRASLNRLSFRDMILVGFMDEEGVEEVLPDIDEMFKADEDGNKPEELSIYAGTNRAIFRNGVAVTSGAMMEKNLGRGDLYDNIWGNMGFAAITAYAGMAAGLGMAIAGGVMMARGVKVTRKVTCEFGRSFLHRCEESAKYYTQRAVDYTEKGLTEYAKNCLAEAQKWEKRVIDINTKGSYVAEKTETFTGVSMTGRWMLGIGAALLLLSAGLEAMNLWMYYDRDMKPIPRMIVDETDIVTYETDSKGNKTIKSISFDQFVYYDSVKCNRPQIGKICDWQDGVKEYKDYYCYDVADLNCDYGKEWLALYTNKSPLKGDPILADSLQVKYGDDKMPAGCTKNLHFFTFDYAIDLGDTAYSYNNDKGGVYVYWDVDKEAGAVARGETTLNTASTFSPGQFALGVAAGFVVGAACVCLIMVILKRKKMEKKAAKEALE